MNHQRRGNRLCEPANHCPFFWYLENCTLKSWLVNDLMLLKQIKLHGLFNLHPDFAFRDADWRDFVVVISFLEAELFDHVDLIRICVEINLGAGCDSDTASLEHD